jgi:hypothetical protein
MQEHMLLHAYFGGGDVMPNEYAFIVQNNIFRIKKQYYLLQLFQYIIGFKF